MRYLPIIAQCAANSANSASRILAKFVANVRQIFFNYVSIFVLESCSNITAGGKFIINNYY